MAYGDVLVTTDGPSYGQSIVRNVGTAGGGGSSFENPYPDPVTFQAAVDFLQDIEMRDDNTFWLDTLKAHGLKWNPDAYMVQIIGDAGQSYWGAAGDLLILSHTGEDGLGTNTPSLNFTSSGIEVQGTLSTQGLLITKAAEATLSGFRLPHGIVPTAPVDGDMWTTPAGLYIRISGVTVGPLS